MRELTGLDAIEYIIVQSLTHKYFLASEVYKGVPELSGVPRAYLEQFVVGGRVMCRDNEMHAPAENSRTSMPAAFTRARWRG